jgi:branched-chain amino acid transport system permease protein
LGLATTLKGFSAAMGAGHTSPRGCIAGGFLLGCTEALVGLWQAEMREITVFVLIIAVLVVKPEGLFGRKPFEKV